MKIRRAAALGAGLGAVYLLLMPALSWGNVVLAVGAAAVAMLALRCRQPLPERTGGAAARRSVLLAPLLAARVLAEVARGSWRVARISLGAQHLPIPGIVRLPIGDRSPLGAIVTGMLLTLTPGSVLVAVDWRRRELLFHIMGMTEREFRDGAELLYERRQRRIVP